jgi:hypothetical protein
MKTILTLALALFSSAALAGGCRDGEVQYFPVNGSGAEGYNYEMPVTCHNGVFFAPAAPVTHKLCREGQSEIWSTGGGDGEPVHTAYYVCHGGRFIETNGAPVPAPAYPSCREGATERFVTGGGDSSPTVTETYVCRGGQYVRTR